MVNKLSPNVRKCCAPPSSEARSPTVSRNTTATEYNGKKSNINDQPKTRMPPSKPRINIVSSWKTSKRTSLATLVARSMRNVRKME